MLLRIVVPVAIILASGAIARADDKAEKTETALPSEKTEDTAWGMGAKVRRSYVPPSIQRLFMEDTPGAATMDGAGIDFARRNGSTEVVFGFGYDRLDASEGYYLEKGGDPLVTGKVDYVTFSRPHWYTVELTAVSHARIHKFLEFRFGGGIGIGWIRGTVRKTDAVCTGASIQQDCMVDPMGIEVNKPADLPPVLPVVNVLMGLKFRPFDFLHIHVDAGLHLVPYLSVGAQLYLW